MLRIANKITIEVFSKMRGMLAETPNTFNCIQVNEDFEVNCEDGCRPLKSTPALGLFFRSALGQV
jgi:hypothetical protein